MQLIVTHGGLSPGVDKELPQSHNQPNVTEEIKHQYDNGDGTDDNDDCFEPNRENDDDCFEPNRQNDNDEQDMGLPADLARVDGAMRWGHNDKTYFFSGG